MSQRVLDLAARGRPGRTILRDGSAVWLRPVGAGDETALRALVEHLSPAALRARFCGEVERHRAADALATGSERGDLAIVAQDGDGPTIVAHAASYRISPEAAEVAFLVADAWQGRGLGAVMFSQLAAAAARQGVTTLHAALLPSNRGMLGVFESCGYPVRIRADVDVWHARIEIEPAAPARAA